MAYIPEEIIQRVQDLADIRQIVAEYVPIRKRGSNWVGLCPFHNDKDPSFTVNEDKQIFHCFGCGVGGSVFKFLMLIEGMTFIEAVKSLANRYGIEIPTHSSQRAGAQQRGFKTEELLECLAFAQEFFSSNLTKSRIGLRAMEYLQGRGLSEDTIDHFGIGWAPDGWDHLVKALKAQGLELGAAKDAGLLAQREGATGFYDRFRARITFPIHDRRGRIVAFGGRLIEDGEPKYINSPEGPLYRKKDILYGYYLNRSYIRTQGLGIVVEGYMDLVALFQHGIKNVCATLGTALTTEHGRLMKGLTKEWLLVFDADEAGLKAAQRALPILYSLGIRPRVLCLPDGHDPDSFVRQEGRAQWEKLVEQADSGIDFVIKQAKRRFGQGPDGWIEASESVIKVLEEIEDPIRKSLLLSYASQKLGVRESLLMDRMKTPKRLRGKVAQDKALVGRKTGTKGVGTTSQAQLLSFILSNPHRMDAFLDAGLEFWLQDQALLNLWQSMVHAYEIFGGLEIERFLDYISTSKELVTMAMELMDMPPPLEDSEETIKRLIAHCQDMKRRTLRRELIAQLKDQEANVEHLLRKIEELH